MNIFCISFWRFFFYLLHTTTLHMSLVIYLVHYCQRWAKHRVEKRVEKTGGQSIGSTQVHNLYFTYRLRKDDLGGT